MTSKVIYKENLRTEMIHLKSGSTIETDAPIDNNGKGERFSPTDLVASALASCMLTVMGIKARDLNIDLDGTEASVTKIMGTEPRRIVGIDVVIQFPASIGADDKQKTILERTALTCPVQFSIHPDITCNISFNW
jgi:putative redox protein